MTEKTPKEILQTLLNPEHERRAETDPRVEILAGMVLDLAVEVEALRNAASAATAESNLQSLYAQAYEETAYLTHNSAGPSSGEEKLLALFYPREPELGRPTSQAGRPWRECLQLRRLGHSEEEIHAYKERAAEAEIFT